MTLFQYTVFHVLYCSLPLQQISKKQGLQESYGKSLGIVGLKKHSGRMRWSDFLTRKLRHVAGVGNGKLPCNMRVWGKQIHPHIPGRPVAVLFYLSSLLLSEVQYSQQVQVLPQMVSVEAVTTCTFTGCFLCTASYSQSQYSLYCLTEINFL